MYLTKINIKVLSTLHTNRNKCENITTKICNNTPTNLITIVPTTKMQKHETEKIKTIILTETVHGNDQPM